VLKFLT